MGNSVVDVCGCRAAYEHTSLLASQENESARASLGIDVVDSPIISSMIPKEVYLLCLAAIR